ncbi:MAG TPA: 3-hydroxyacyl-CoA dehydrogenase NAD-binding domain-containing protein [Candidatus Limnocylindria bacterium]|nr:3-hydroxyacyl-CoA dehydrogenase NAD-binding domain-containing protein [Candidatus Limnocylindria bacterium]
MREIRTIAVVGAGVMGAGIAQVATETGHLVRLFDPTEGATTRARQRIAGFLERKVAKGQLSTEEANAAVDRIGEAEALAVLGDADLVIEAVPEDLELKRGLFADLDRVLAHDVILATNTSSLSVARIASATEHPERVAGMHFFNPVPLMQLVELIAGPMTPDAVLASLDALARRLGKTPVVAADTPGFIVNRVQRALYLESFRIFEEGLAGVAAIDEAIRQIGFRMGAFELADVVGTDVNLAAGEAIFDGFHADPRYRPAQVQQRVVDAGRLGRKTNAGYYDYDVDGTRGEPWSALTHRPEGSPLLPAIEPAQIEARVLATIVNEAASAVADGVAAPEAIDTAMRLASNWPEGPLAWGERIGLEPVVHTLDALHLAVPDGRYRVTPLLRSLALSGGSFFART